MALETKVQVFISKSLRSNDTKKMLPSLLRLSFDSFIVTVHSIRRFG